MSFVKTKAEIAFDYYASYSEELGTRMSLSMQRTMVSRRYREVFPHMMVGVPGWIANNSMTEFARYQGSFRCTTINGPITGLGLNLGLLDDYVKGRAEANSKLLRDKTWAWFADDFLTRFSKDGAFLGIATRWHIDDLFGRLKKKWPEMRILNFPAFAEKEEGWRHKGDPLFPAHRPIEMWLDQKRIMSEASWAAEYQGHPFLSGSGAIPVEKLKVVPFFDRNNVMSTVMAIDKAGTEGGDGAFTAIVIMSKMRDGTFVIEDVLRGHWAALERARSAVNRMHCRCQSIRHLASRLAWPVANSPRLKTAWGGWRGRSWAYFGFGFGCPHDPHDGANLLSRHVAEVRRQHQRRPGGVGSGLSVMESSLAQAWHWKGEAEPATFRCHCDTGLLKPIRPARCGIAHGSASPGRGTIGGWHWPGRSEARDVSVPL